jgi:hypothetical protein
MKNYLVGALRPVINIWGYWKGQGENPNRDQDLAEYTGMYDVSRAAARKFLAGAWQEKVFRSPVLDARQFCIAQWYAIKELWHSEPCNILWMGSDTLMTKPTAVFGEWHGMRMFNYTNPRSIANIPHYFNDDVRYYPADMDPKIWDVGERAMTQWFTNPEAKWDLGQMIHNYQFWSQDIDDADRLHPWMNWSAHGMRDFNTSTIDLFNAWNGLDMSQAHVIHLSGSRGPAQGRQHMLDLVKYFNLDIG